MKSLSERLVRHVLAHDPSQTAMLVGGPDPFFAIHLIKFLESVDNDLRAIVCGRETWRWKLRSFNRDDNLVNPAALLLTDVHAPHQVGHALVPRLVAVDKPVCRDHRFTRIRKLDPIAVNLNDG